FSVAGLGHRGLGPGVAGRGQGILHGGRAQPGEQNADHRAGHSQAFGDRLLGPPLPGPHPGWATWRSLSLGGRPRRATSPTEPWVRARPRRIDTYVAVNPNTAATSSTRLPASV